MKGLLKAKTPFKRDVREYGKSALFRTRAVVATLVLAVTVVFAACSTGDDDTAGGAALADIYGYRYLGNITARKGNGTALSPRIRFFNENRCEWEMSTTWTIADGAPMQFWYKVDKQTGTARWETKWYSKKADMDANANEVFIIVVAINNPNDIVIMAKKAGMGAGNQMENTPIDMHKQNDSYDVTNLPPILYTTQGAVNTNPIVLTVGTPVTLNIHAESGVEPYVYTITDGALAPGLTLNQSTGEITGTPTEKTNSVSGIGVTVTDKNGRKSSTRFYYRIN